MNPYNFVRIPWDQGPQRLPYVPLDRYLGLSGRLRVQVTAETPVFIPHAEDEGERDRRISRNRPAKFIRNGHDRYIIPATTLKGLIRNLVETLAPGCWLFFDGEYRSRREREGQIVTDLTECLPEAFARCTNPSALCPACRMFGFVRSEGGDDNGATDVAVRGRVEFTDAVCHRAVEHEPIYTPVLVAPKPRHEIWYRGEGGRLAGRKYYYHQANVQRAQGLQRSRGGRPLNQYITPLAAGSTFAFQLSFNNMDQAELDIMLFAIVLEPGMRHKLGYGKPIGLGSVRLEIQEIIIWPEPRARYAGRDPEVFTGPALDKEVQEAAVRAERSISPCTLDDLRSIWAWPPAGHYRYPGRDWFQAHPHAPIAETP